MHGLLATGRTAVLMISTLAGLATAQGVHPDEPTMIPNIIVPPARRTMHHRFENAVKLEAVNARVEIEDQTATTSLELVLANGSSSVQQAELLIPVPDGVSVRGLSYDGLGAEPTASVLPRGRAREIYDEIVRRAKDPALAEFAGYNLIRTSAFPVPPGAKQKLTIVFEQVLTLDGERIDYTLPRSESFNESGVAWSVKVSIHNQRGIATVYSPTHDIAVDRQDPSRSVVSVADAHGMAPGAFRLSYLPTPRQKDMMSAALYAYPDPSIGHGSGGYFLLLASLPDAPKKDAHGIRREVVLVLDRSGSMAGEKIEQVRTAAMQIIDGLNEGESFNIIDYSDSIQSYAAAPVAKTRASAEEARAYLKQITDGGGTNIHDALLEGVRQPPTAGSLPMILFLTDGLPTVGERRESSIRADVMSMNRAGKRIFSFGVGYDVNAPLLNALSTGSRGTATMVLPGENVEGKVSAVFSRLSGPMLTEPTITFLDAGGATTTRAVRELQPSALNDVYEHDQVVILGQYTEDGPMKFRLKGRQADGEHAYEFSFPGVNASARNGFVPRIWATRKIAALTEEIRQDAAAGGTSEARSKELIEEIVRLSSRWGIMTEYTSFLATDESQKLLDLSLPMGDAFASDPGAKKAYHRSKEKLEAGAASRSGSEGVAQQENYSLRMESRTASAARSAFKDGEMNDVRLTGVQQVADRVLFRRGGRWLDSELGGKEDAEPEVTIEFGTDEYLRILEALANEGRQGLLAMGGDVYLIRDGKRTLVKGPRSE